MWRYARPRNWWCIISVLAAHFPLSSANCSNIHPFLSLRRFAQWYHKLQRVAYETWVLCSFTFLGCFHLAGAPRPSQAGRPSGGLQLSKTRSSVDFELRKHIEAPSSTRPSFHRSLQPPPPLIPMVVDIEAKPRARNRAPPDECINIPSMPISRRGPLRVDSAVRIFAGPFLRLTVCELEG